MPVLIFLSYFVLEALAFWVVSHFIGVGWTFLALFGLMVIGFILAGFEMQQVARAAISGQRSAGRTAVDYGLITAGSICLVVPGFLTSLLGLTLIIPATRSLVRAILARRTQRWIEQLGQRGYERAAQFRPQTNYGSFADPDRPVSSDQPSVDREVIDEDELAEWSENLDPSDFDDRDTK